jgi:hypothetical protein
MQHVYILIASLLVEQLGTYANHGGPAPPHPELSLNWQLKRMLGILRGQHDQVSWHRTSIANWPVYTVGLFVSTSDDVALIREAMRRRWVRTHMYLIAKYNKDLEGSWAWNRNGTNMLREPEDSSKCTKVTIILSSPEDRFLPRNDNINQES